MKKLLSLIIGIGLFLGHINYSFAESPVVEDSASFSGSGSNFSVTLPTGITSGDLLIMIVGFNQFSTVTISGWTQASVQEYFGKYYVFYKVASGSEGATQSVSYGTTTNCVAQTYRISGNLDVGSYPPEVGVANGSLDPPSLSPSYGSQDYLWIASANVEQNGSGAYINGYPSGYSNTGNVAISSALALGWGTKESTATSENPSTFAGAPAAYYTSRIIAIPGEVTGWSAFSTVIGVDPTTLSTVMGADVTTVSTFMGVSTGI